MVYGVHSDHDRRHMLDVVGLSSVDDLFEPVPASLLASGPSLPSGLSEHETRTHVECLAARNIPATSLSFLGAGYYRHFVPAAVRSLTSRAEFVTAYTPYQAEVSQGTLQSIFEFQTAICELTGLDVANASLYDGPSALAEAAFMALRLKNKEGILVSAGVHPQAAQVVSTYANGPGLKVYEWPLDPAWGTTTLTSGPPEIPAGVGVVLVQQPNHLGVVEDLASLSRIAHDAGALLVVMHNPMTLGVLEAPGRLGVDIAVGDVQVFGSSPTFGGPSAGYLACRQEHLRQLPGRLVGQTVDLDGRACYTLTLQAREQHIRRAKATSNVCSNQALVALAATIHLALLGPEGLREMGELCLRRAHYLCERLCDIPGVRSAVCGPFFHEFALELPLAAAAFVEAMRTHGIDPGVPLDRPALDRKDTNAFLKGGAPSDRVLLVAVTELNGPSELDRYVAAAREVLAGPHTATGKTP